MHQLSDICGTRHSCTDMLQADSTIHSRDSKFPVRDQPVDSTSIRISLPGGTHFCNAVLERVRSLHIIYWKNGVSRPFLALFSVKNLSHSVYDCRQAYSVNQSMVLRRRNE